MKYQTVMVGTDGSDSSFGAVDRAASVAGAEGATLIIVTAYRPISTKVAQDAADVLGSEAYKVAGSFPAEQVLNEASARARLQGAEDVEAISVEGEAVDALVAEARRRKVDLLVVGNRGLNSLAGRLLGSVPANLTHKAACDVLIVHTTGKGTGSR